MKQSYLSMKVSIIIGFMLLSQKSISQCQISYENNGTNVFTNQPYLWGQSFMASCNGNLEYVQLIADGTGTVSSGTLRIYDGSTVSDTPIYTQSYPSITINNIGDPIRVNVTGNVPLIQNMQYTFEFTVDNVDVLADFNGGYPGGSPFQDGVEYNTVDLVFNVSLTSPTLSMGDVSSHHSITVFPNPANHYISVSQLKDNRSYSIINSLGQAVLKGMVSADEIIDIRNLKNGLYFLKFDDGNNLKFVKN